MGNPPSRENSKPCAKKVRDTEIAKNILSITVPSDRIIGRMTRARTASYGVVTPPPLDRWIEAVLMLCVSLVQGAATTLGMIFNCNRRDWHTAIAHEDLPQAKSGIQTLKASNPAAGTGGMEADKVRVPGEGRGPVLRAAQTHAHQPSRTRTALSPLIPANARIQGDQQDLSRLAASVTCVSHRRSWSPTCVGMSGAMRAIA
jgi:hypothetical protein